MKFIKKCVFIPVLVLFFLSDYSHSSSHLVSNPIVDSNLTIDEALKGLIPGCPVEIINNQTLVDVLYYSVDGLIHKGQIVVDKGLANDVAEVFQAALDDHFPIKSIIPISHFNWNDDVSMAQNNTSGFNYRPVTGAKKLSNHGLRIRDRY